MLDLHAANLRTVSDEVKHVPSVLRRHRRLVVLAVEVARVYHLTLEDFQSKARTRDVAHPRQEFMLAAHRMGYSTPELARFLNRDHTTILHGIRAAEKREAAERGAHDDDDDE